MGALSIPIFEIDATAACMYIGRDASDAHGRACSGPSAWRPASVEAPVAGVDKVSPPENSGFPLRMWLRSWLQHAKAGRGAGGRCDRFWTIEKRRRECTSSRAHSERVSEGDSVTAQAVF